jgi:hypothetical protein
MMFKDDGMQGYVVQIVIERLKEAGECAGRIYRVIHGWSIPITGSVILMILLRTTLTPTASTPMDIIPTRIPNVYNFRQQ